MDIVVFAATFIICLFILYILSKQDFVLLRQNISLSQIFDALGISLISAFLFARVIYVVNNFKSDLLSVLRFFHVIKYPGLSFYGFIAGGALCLFLIFMKKKGVGRIMDVFAISFFPLFAMSLIFENRLPADYAIIPYISFALCIFVFIFFIRSHQKYILRDGSISLIFLLLLSIQTASYQYVIGSTNKILANFSVLAIVAIAAIPVTLVQLIITQRRKVNR